MADYGAVESGLGKVFTVSHSLRVTHAALEMHEHRVGCLVVVDDDGTAIGVISERDILRWVGTGRPETYYQRVCDVMTRRIVSGWPGISQAEARELMCSHGIRHLPILEGGAAVGMISIRDVVARESAPSVA